MLNKFKKFKAPKWFQDLHKEATEEEQETFEYLSEVIGYGPEWCKQNVGKCLEKLDSRKRIDVIKQLNKADIINSYAWSKFCYENWGNIKDLVGLKPPEYNSKKKTIQFSKTTVFDKIKKNFKI